MLVNHYQGGLDLLTLYQRSPTQFPFLLESVSVSPLSRYSILFAYPQEVVRIPFGAERDFLTVLDQHWQQAAMAYTPDPVWQHLPFRGGWFLFMSYELAGQVEPVLQLQPDPQGLPLGLACRIPVAVIRDHTEGLVYVVAEDAYLKEFNELSGIVANLIEESFSAPLAMLGAEAVQLTEDEPGLFTAGVETIRDYIRAGDVFQVNLSRAWQATLPPDVDAAAIYQRLRTANPAPFACLADFGDFAVISSSPERLVSVRDGWADTRPIAGTRPRGQDHADDQRQLAELIAHPKERAEHIMLIDLERNDLGRVCAYGSVMVNELMVVESYQHVHHIVSNVRGHLRPNTTPGQVIRAVFPGGTITGCPKVRCMEIIHELEQTGRGAYTGSIGYLNHDGEMDLSILIRTMTLSQQHLWFRTGAGIVIDSLPERELEETRHKARGLLRALGDTVS